MTVAELREKLKLSLPETNVSIQINEFDPDGEFAGSIVYDLNAVQIDDIGDVYLVNFPVTEDDQR